MLIVLDSLGVIFRTRDGWPAHLTRFVAAKGGVRAESERDRFVANYFACTLGELSTSQLWEWCGLDPSGLDDEYVEFFDTTTGLAEFFVDMHRRGHQVACVTNDAAVWSRALRRRHNLDAIAPWIVSSEIGVRKPDEDIFRALERDAGRPIEGALFVDDTEPNLDGAARLGMRTVHYRGDARAHRRARSWDQVAHIVTLLETRSS